MVGDLTIGGNHEGHGLGFPCQPIGLVRAKTLMQMNQDTAQGFRYLLLHQELLLLSDLRLFWLHLGEP